MALIRQQPAYSAAAGRVHAFEADLTAHDLVAAGGIAPGSVDLATMVFVLSAIHPQHMAAVSGSG